VVCEFFRDAVVEKVYCLLGYLFIFILHESKSFVFNTLAFEFRNAYMLNIPSSSEDLRKLI
jgi:hypothetical protein